MNKKYLFIGIVFLFAGCSSVPKKDLSTRTGVIAAYFTVETEEVSQLREKGYDEDKIVKFLIVESGTYLTREEIEQKLQAGQTIEEIAAEAGIEEKELNEKSQKILEELSKY